VSGGGIACGLPFIWLGRLTKAGALISTSNPQLGLIMGGASPYFIGI
jgi:hypothetical protein